MTRRVGAFAAAMAALVAILLGMPSRAQACVSVACLTLTYVDASVSQNGGVNLYDYHFTGERGGDTLVEAQVLIPILDPGSYVSSAFAVTPTGSSSATLVTDPSTINSMWSSISFPTVLAPEFLHPAAVLYVSLSFPNPTFGITLDVTIGSYAGSVSGPIAYNYDGTPIGVDPPVPGILPEPGTIVLMGTALVVLGVKRRSRRTP
ncbi:MAG: PEP-CTERM sorting domain-containing protein [Proteobacteria bacterium]|nr:PEP-CTERM sorting domain-containing protein [Pseudomonadota bacterium]